MDALLRNRTARQTKQVKICPAQHALAALQHSQNCCCRQPVCPEAQAAYHKHCSCMAST